VHPPPRDRARPPSPSAYRQPVCLPPRAPASICVNMEYQLIDEFALALMASAPLRRCECPRAAERDCSALRCWACYTSMLEVVDWAHWNVADVNGQWMPWGYIRLALLHDEARWNAVRRGLMMRPAAEIEVRVRVERADADAAAIAVSRAIAGSIAAANSMVCTICMEAVQAEARYLPCMHAFHRGCIGAWLRRQRTCPVCRSEL